MALQKVELCLKKKGPTPSTNIPLLSLQKSEQTNERKSEQSCLDYLKIVVSIWITFIKTVSISWPCSNFFLLPCKWSKNIVE